MKGISYKTDSRLAKEDDFNGIKRVVANHWSVPPVRFKAACPSDASYIAQREDNIYFVAEIQHDVVGYLSMQNYGMCLTVANIEVVVDPKFRKCGVGLNLLTHAIKHAEEKTELKQLIAMVPKDNEPSIGLLKKCNFREIDSRPLGTKWVLEIVR